MTTRLQYKSLTVRQIAPVTFHRTKNGLYAIDFGKAWFGRLRFSFDSPCSDTTLIIRLGEVLLPNGQIDRNPAGTARFRELTVELKSGTTIHEVQIPPDPGNTGARTIKMPDDIGEVLPFRYAEIEGAPSDLRGDNVRLAAVHYPFNGDASSFECSNGEINAVWDLCKHTIIATSFCGFFVDGDRERYPREADAYINQLGHYGIDAEYGLARRTHEFMIQHSSRWTEWLYHSIFMAWADMLYTGDVSSARRFYPDLEAKLLLALTREDGLVSTVVPELTDYLLRSLYRYEGEHVRGYPRVVDIVDWPKGERDSYEFTDYNTVVNSFLFRALTLMSRISCRLGDRSTAGQLMERADLVHRSFQYAFFDHAQGLYVDGEGSAHASLHANLFPLAFGLAPPTRKERILAFVKDKGMACSVYAAQYLLEALFREGQADYALELMVADTDRSWKHMLDQDATTTFEAWDVKDKENMDRNHAWGAAPANILPRYVLGVRPVEIGGDRIVIAPQPGALSFARGTVPLRHGGVMVDYCAKENSKARLRVEIPDGVTAEVVFGGLRIPDVDAGIHEFHADNEQVARARRMKIGAMKK